MEIVYSNDYLAHHGILGQKWGVRRYQNPDGSLTEAGKKRYGYAADQARIEANQSRALAKDYIDSHKAFEERYSGPKAKAHYLEDQFGVDSKNERFIKDYIRAMGGPDNVNQWVKESIKSDIEYDKNVSESMAEYYEKEAKRYDSLVKKYENTKLSDLDKSSLKEARQLTKEYLKYLKLKNKYNWSD